MSRAGRVLWLICACGRNLADVSKPMKGPGSSLHNPDWTRDGLMVAHRPNVQHRDYRPWHAANMGGPVGTPERAAATPGLVEGVDFDWHDWTYTWYCKCGRSPTLRHERISEQWRQVEGKPYTRSAWRLVVDA